MRKRGLWLVFTGLAITLISILYIKTSASQDDTLVEIEIDSTFFELPTLYYGYEIDSFDITEGKVKWNQNLSEILSSYNISYQDIHTLAKSSKEVYDVRRLKAGSNYSIIHDRDSLKTARQFIFEPSATEYVIYNLVDTIYADLHKKPIKTTERQFVAEINSSVYNAILDQGGSPMLVKPLVDVFAWQVDFFRIAKGDKFKLIFDEETVDGKIVGVKNIRAAYFEHWGKPYYAIAYPTEEKIDYFDVDGNSLRKTLKKAPLNYSRISSRFSLRRFHPVQKRYKAHLGTDYAAPRGTPIETVGDGLVLEARYHSGNGNYVKIKHNSNYTTQYLHMSKIATGIRPGVKVKQGQVIGYVGSTGLATGPHLCYRFWVNGRQVDALKVDLPSSSGISEAQMEEYQIFSDSIKNILDNIEIVKKEPLLAKIPSEEDLTQNP